jgi:hypothetical protein|tara:strand:- start:35 stop:187 length:153 start_codon:yes stop_codon:yes gene_type:complete
MTSLAATYSLTKSFLEKKNGEKSDIYLNKRRMVGEGGKSKEIFTLFYVFI